MLSKDATLSKQLCPHTGIVNYFSKADPYISVGSIAEAKSQAEYHWRIYSASRTISGIAADMKTAEQRLKTRYREAAGDQA